MIEKIMTLSTAHISEETARLLDCLYMTDKWKLIVYSKAQYGWFIPMGFDELVGVPSDLMKCLEYALGEECSWLCLDRDGDIVDELPTYNW